MKLLLLTIFMTTQISFAMSFRGGGMGNGGHPYEIQFKQDAMRILELLKKDVVEKPDALKKIDLYQLDLNIELVEVELKRKKLKDKFGRVRSALNFPGKRLIQINKKDWEKIQSIDSLRLPLVLHEYLGISNEEVDNYDISSNLYSYVEKVKALEHEERLRDVNSKFEKDKSQLAKEFYDRLSKVNIVKSRFEEDYKNKMPGLKEVVDIDVKEIEFVYQINLHAFAEIDKSLLNQFCSDFGYLYGIGSSSEDKGKTGYALGTNLSYKELKSFYMNKNYSYRMEYSNASNKKHPISKIQCGR